MPDGAYLRLDSFAKASSDTNHKLRYHRRTHPRPSAAEVASCRKKVAEARLRGPQFARPLTLIPHLAHLIARTTLRSNPPPSTSAPVCYHSVSRPTLANCIHRFGLLVPRQIIQNGRPRSPSVSRDSPGWHGEHVRTRQLAPTCFCRRALTLRSTDIMPSRIEPTSSSSWV